MTAAPFLGFPEECVKFLIELRNNNNRDWFNAHKKDYEQYVKEPTQAFGAAMAEALSTLSPSSEKTPNVNFSAFRIYRDIRFSKDVTLSDTDLTLFPEPEPDPFLDLYN